MICICGVLGAVIGMKPLRLHQKTLSGQNRKVKTMENDEKCEHYPEGTEALVLMLQRAFEESDAHAMLSITFHEFGAMFHLFPNPRNLTRKQEEATIPRGTAMMMESVGTALKATMKRIEEGDFDGQ